VPRPLVLRPVPHDDLPDRGAGVQVVGLAEQPAGDASAAGHPAGVRRLRAVEQSQQGGLATAVAPHDADAVAVQQAQRDVIQEGLGADRQADAVDADERGHAHPVREGSGWADSGSTWAPGTGPTARLISPCGPRAARPTDRSIASDGESTRKATVGPEPETTAPRTPSSRPAWRTSPSSGSREIAASCRSLRSAAPTAAVSIVRSAARSSSDGSGSGTARPARNRSYSAYTSGVDRPRSERTQSTQCSSPRAST